ncbi:hypothetical protein B0H17DRAFT_1033053 [Mycena rosella]|uniref:Uncharacterized protein n=1 Tax=Mycena rosella TaxID=1033263 RepID=A0AAD7GXT8_MYCRO|nr:hypothetical protein B0H17DRAFT_1033053 [Mycena rosella]
MYPAMFLNGTAAVKIQDPTSFLPSKTGNIAYEVRPLCQNHPAYTPRRPSGGKGDRNDLLGSIARRVLQVHDSPLVRQKQPILERQAAFVRIHQDPQLFLRKDERCVLRRVELGGIWALTVPRDVEGPQARLLSGVAAPVHNREWCVVDAGHSDVFAVNGPETAYSLRPPWPIGGGRLQSLEFVDELGATLSDISFNFGEREGVRDVSLVRIGNKSSPYNPWYKNAKPVALYHGLCTL